MDFAEIGIAELFITNLHSDIMSELYNFVALPGLLNHYYSKGCNSV